MNWAMLLPSAEFAYNNSRSASTRMSPFKALYGYDPDLQTTLRTELRTDTSPEDSASQGEAPAAYDRIARLTELRQQLRDHLL
jgi:hypothetical protein